ncbi:MAG: LamG-like jellyroll fold domain-containing protein [Flavobacterium psychrophilum]
MKKLILLLLFLGQFAYSQSWINRPNLPSTARTAVASFSIGSKGYFVGGESSGANLFDVWEYDTSSNTWSQKANYPGTPSSKGVAFSINGIGYYGLGNIGSGGDSGALYSYNPTTNTWTQKATCTLAGVGFWSTTYFVVGTKVYFLDRNNKFFSYDSLTDSWTSLTDFTGTKRVTGVGFTLNNKGYICTGINSTAGGNLLLNDLWEYNPTNNSWVQKASLPSVGRYASFGFSFNNKGYVLGGEKSSSVMTNEFWEYNPTSDSWTSLTNYISGAKNYLSGFVANNSVYAGFGSPGYGVSFNEYGFFNQSSSFCTSLSGSLQNGLISYWPFCGNANDDTGNGNNGTVNGATLTTDRFGNNNSAYNFVKANNNYITMNNTVGNFGTSDFSISAWYSSTDNISSHIINKRFSQSWGNYWELTKFLFGINDTNNNSNYNFINNNQAQSTNTWYNITITRNGTSLKYYINGLLYQTITTTVINNISNTSNLVIGAVLTPLTGVLQSHDGKIDDIGIWNRALTQQEVTQLFNQNQCITNITVTDTLIINVGQLSYTNPISFANNITIYPNPASTQVNISFNNITDLAGGSIKIINSLGQQVDTNPITLSGTNTTMALNSWGGTGLYFVQILNAQGQIVDIKKIILQ